MATLGVGVLGLRMGRNWAAAFAEDERTRLAAVYDPNEERAAEVVGELGGEACASWQALVERTDVDVVVVASPDAFHAEQAVAAFGAGKHVIIEKPMVVTMEQCDAVVAAADAAGTIGMSGYVLRQSPLGRKLKQLVDSGGLGEVFYAEGHYLVNFHFDTQPGLWRGSAEHRHWPLLGSACHVIDLLSWLVGRITEVSCYANAMCYTPEQYPFWDCQVAACTFATGAVGRVLSAYAPVFPHENRYRLFGRTGTYDGYTERLYLTEHDWEPFVPDEAGEKRSAVAGEADEFLRCLAAGEQPDMDIRNGAYVAAVALAAEESIHTGQPVPVRQF